jgi:hypothetical protein
MSIESILDIDVICQPIKIFETDNSLSLYFSIAQDVYILFDKNADTITYYTINDGFLFRYNSLDHRTSDILEQLLHIQFRLICYYLTVKNMSSYTDSIIKDYNDLAIYYIDDNKTLHGPLTSKQSAYELLKSLDKKRDSVYLLIFSDDIDFNEVYGVYSNVDTVVNDAKKLLSQHGVVVESDLKYELIRYGIVHYGCDFQICIKKHFLNDQITQQISTIKK